MIFWHHRMLGFMSIQSLLVSFFIDSSHDHLYTVLLFIDDSKNILFVSCAFWYVLHPTIDCLWLGFIPSFISCLWLFACYWIHCLSLDIQAIYPYNGPPTSVQTRACGPLKKTYKYLAARLHFQPRMNCIVAQIEASGAAAIHPTRALTVSGNFPLTPLPTRTRLGQPCIRPCSSLC